MEIRKGEKKDVPGIMAIINAAKSFFRENGIDQWQKGTPDEKMVENDIKNGESYVVADGDKVLATCMISLRGEPTYGKLYNGKWLSDGSYGVIHRVAVAPGSKKSGLASFMIKQAEIITLSAGFTSLRADTHENNVPMRNMLEKNGFVYCGGIILSDGSPRRAYEKILN